MFRSYVSRSLMRLLKIQDSTAAAIDLHLRYPLPGTSNLREAKPKSALAHDVVATLVQAACNGDFSESGVRSDSGQELRSDHKQRTASPVEPL